MEGKIMKKGFYDLVICLDNSVIAQRISARVMR